MDVIGCRQVCTTGNAICVRAPRSPHSRYRDKEAPRRALSSSCSIRVLEEASATPSLEGLIYIDIKLLIRTQSTLFLFLLRDGEVIGKPQPGSLVLWLHKSLGG